MRPSILRSIHLSSTSSRSSSSSSSLRSRALATAARLLDVAAHPTSSFATVDPESLSASKPHQVHNFVNGNWSLSSSSSHFPDPLNGDNFIKVPETNVNELQDFVRSLRSCPKYGLHNPLRNPERYLLYGDICAKAAFALRQPEVETFFAKLIQRVSPKSFTQAQTEVSVSEKFLENFSGDQVRFLASSFAVPGNHLGQISNGFRWPYGPVTVITPFNFPLEIPLLQIMGALFMGNKVLLKVDSKVSIVMEQMLKMLHACGLPPADVDFINCDGTVMNKLLVDAKPAMTLFTGSSRVAEKLALDLSGRVRIEDAGFDWKILGPDVNEAEYVAWVCDQDAYACSGQKCSAQSILFMHENWKSADLMVKLKNLAARRRLEDLTIGPVLTVTTKAMLDHIEKLLKIPGAYLVFGGKPLVDHRIPEIYGAVEPSAVFVPIDQILKDEHFSLVTKEIFGPFQVVTEYKDVNLVLEACERMGNHLTAAVVSSDVQFVQEVLGKTVNGTTYAGLRARTTGAPQNHWFGPAGDPRGAGIGTPQAIKAVWSCHREIIHDFGPIPGNWKLPPST